MAEALFKKMAARLPNVTALSAGVNAIEGFAATEETVRVMKEEEGLDVSEHRSRRLTPEMIRDADRIFVMESSHKDAIVRMVPEAANKVAMLTDYISEDGPFERRMDIPDPIRMSDNFYKNVLDVVRGCIRKIVEHLEKGK